MCMRVWIKRIGIVFLIPVVCLLLASILLYIPAVQNAAMKKAMKVISESTGWDVDIGYVRLAFPLDFSLCDAVIKGADNDTIACLGKLTVDVHLKPLLKGQISVKGLLLESLDLNTGDILEGMVISGNIGKAYLQADSVNLSEEQAWVNHIVLSDAEINLFICDTTVTDTATSTLNWCIDLKKVELKNVAFTCRMPCDSIYVNLRVDEAVLADGFVDLGAGLYCASEFRALASELFYGMDLDETEAAGMDFSHIRLNEVVLVSDSLYYEGGSNTICAIIRNCSAKERSGLVLKSAAGRVDMDSAQFNVPGFLLETPFSTVQLQAIVPWSSIDAEKPEGRFSLTAKAHVHKRDVILMTGNLPDSLQAFFVDSVIFIEAAVGGNTKEMTIQKFDCLLPNAFQFRLTGSAASLTDEKLRSGTVDFSVETQNMDFIAELFPALLPQGFQIPDTMQLTGQLTFEKDIYASEMLWEESLAKIRFSGNYDALSDSYDVNLKIDSLEPVHFMPDDSVLWLSAFVRASGQGTDMYHPSTRMELTGGINELLYGSFALSENVAFSANLKENKLQASIESNYPLVKGRISMDGVFQKENLNGMLIIDVDSLDFYGLGMTESPLSTSFQLFSEFETDLDKTHTFDLTLGNWSLVFEDQTVEPKMMTLALRSDVDTVRASFYAGDLHIMITGNSDLESLTDQLIQLSQKAEEQFKSDTAFHIQELRPYFPDLTLHVNAERDNPVYNFLQEYNTFFESLHFDATVSPDDGLKVDGMVLAIVKDTFKIDTVRFDMWQDTLGLLYAAAIVKNRFRNQEAFKVDVSGFIRKNEVDVLASYMNNRGEKGLYLGVNAQKVSDGFNFYFYPKQPVIAFLPFTVNEDNYFLFKNRNEMEADLRLDGRANSSIWIHSTHQDESMKDMMVEFMQINLRDISNGFPDLPSLRGLLNISFRYEPEDNSFLIIGDGNIDDLYYENGRIGDLLLNATYMPFGEGTHQIDVHAFHNMSDIMSLSVLYQEGEVESRIDGAFSINRFPLNIANAMIPNQMARLEGFLNGTFTISGTDINPVLGGTLQVDQGSVHIAPSSTTLHFDDRPVQVTNNKINLNQFRIYSQSEQPFIIDGSIDATNTGNPTVNLNMSASNLQLIDARRMPENLVFGRLLVNFNSTVNGPLDALRMRGNLRILGNTNLTYVMSDSPLDAQDNFGNLVTFTYFADTLPRRDGQPFYMIRGTGNAAAAAGTDVLMNISIDPVVRFRVDLDEDQSNFVELRGGGDLSLHYTTQGEINLNGRYTLSEGTIRYAIPVIPLTGFTIRNGSYVEWNGDPMNPYLNITAYTQLRSSINLDGQSRMVDFNAGIQLRDNLEDVSVQFLLEAPTDAIIQNQLASMGVEERSKQAISLLVTGVYLASKGTGSDNLDVSAALSSLLQREIKNILGNLLGDVPFSFDVNTYDGTQGMGRRVDYIGRFSREFFDERFNTTVGLRYSTDDPIFGDKFFPDDISLEYRLDTDGSRAIQLFRSREYENTFEGEITKTGASFSIRRKVKRLNDLFIFRKQDTPTLKKNEEYGNEGTEEF